MRATGAALAWCFLLTGCAAVAEREAAWREAEATRREAYCTDAGYAPGTDAHKLCQQIEALNQRLAEVDQRLNRLELDRAPLYGPWFWP
jgi:TolA-binding protein